MFRLSAVQGNSRCKFCVLESCLLINRPVKYAGMLYGFSASFKTFPRTYFLALFCINLTGWRSSTLTARDPFFPSFLSFLFHLSSLFLFLIPNFYRRCETRRHRTTRMTYVILGTRTLYRESWLVGSKPLPIEKFWNYSRDYSRNERSLAVEVRDQKLAKQPANISRVRRFTVSPCRGEAVASFSRLKWLE